MNVESILSVIIILIVVVNSLVFSICAFKLSRKRSPRSKEFHGLSYLRKKSADAINYYTINIRTNSNIIAINEPYYLLNSSNEALSEIQEEEANGLDLKCCQLCGALTDIKENYCYYCGSKLGFAKKRRI
ncbi:MAG: hypothetical protein ACFFAH_05545 [Promethearchaeota archaeon]